MANKARIDPMPPQAPGTNDIGSDEALMPRKSTNGHEPRQEPARPDPNTGEVPAGPGDAGLQDRPALNQGSPGTKQMSNRRLGVGLGILVLVSVLAFIFAAIF